MGITLPAVYFFEVLGTIYSMKSLPCSVAIVRPKKPFITWANSCSYDGEYSREYFVTLHSLVILIPQYDSIRVKEARQYINSLWDDIFIQALHRWNSDEAVFPKDRTKDMFKKWFDVEFQWDVVTANME